MKEGTRYLIWVYDPRVQCSHLSLCLSFLPLSFSPKDLLLQLDELLPLLICSLALSSMLYTHPQTITYHMLGIGTYFLNLILSLTHTETTILLFPPIPCCNIIVG